MGDWRSGIFSRFRKAVERHDRMHLADHPDDKIWQNKLVMTVPTFHELAYEDQRARGHIRIGDGGGAEATYKHSGRLSDAGSMNYLHTCSDDWMPLEGYPALPDNAIFVMNDKGGFGALYDLGYSVADVRVDCEERVLEMFLSHKGRPIASHRIVAPAVLRPGAEWNF
jgi:hypothetical protein